MKPLTREEIETYMREGSDAFINNMDKDEDMPYSRYSDKGRLWLRGYANAEYGSLTYSCNQQNGKR